MEKFKLQSEFEPMEAQQEAIESLSSGLDSGKRHQVLLGVTGSGKTFTMANVIERLNRPALVLSHNKTLAAQLYREFKDFFPENSVEYFVSYYDYYQPEAYVPARDLFIDKDSDVNDEIDRLRLKATSSLLQRRDVIIVASVSCIYGLGSPEDYKDLYIILEEGMEISREEIIERLISIQYTRTKDTLERSSFRVIGDTLEIMSAYSDELVRVEMFGDEIERLSRIDPLNRTKLAELNSTVIYPAKHFVTTEDKLMKGIKRIEKELDLRYRELKEAGKQVEAERIFQRTKYDLEMLREMGYCAGIENYSRQLAGRGEGERPACLLDYFPEDFITFIDESHVTIPQVRGMYNGDRARKQTLVDYGFRLPSALDNRPLLFDEFESVLGQRVYVSATPKEYEHEHSENTVEQIIRPTGLLDPTIEVVPTEGQIDRVIDEIQSVCEKGERVLITTLTKKMAEDLTYHLGENGVKVQYMHSDIDTVERVEIIRNLRRGEFDVLVGINLLREGLDIPEVSLVMILDADKIGFLRSANALIQTAGRAARNSNGRVIMFADKISDAMQKCIDETQRRRSEQIKYNEEHGITPTTIKKKVQDIIQREEKVEQNYELHFDFRRFSREYGVSENKDKASFAKALEEEMNKASENLEFEKAIEIRERLKKLQSGKGSSKRKKSKKKMSF